MSYNYQAYPWGRWIKWGIVALVVLVLVFSTIGTYNGLTASEQEVDRDWSQVENVMQARADKITNLVEVVKGYVKHEEKVFGDIAAARSVLMNENGDVDSKLKADSQLGDATRSMLLLVENYPDLKASEQFTNLQEQIEGAENRVSVERKRFIDSVQKYNVKVKRFPGSVFAGVMGFEPRDYFQADPEAQKSPEVKF